MENHIGKGLTSCNSGCSLEFGAEDLFWSSPGFASGDEYPNSAYCSVSGSTEAPRQAVYTFNHFHLQNKIKTREGSRCIDAVGFSLPGQRVKKLCGAQYGVYSVPAFRFQNEFVSNRHKTARGFNITIRAVKTSCHQVIDLRFGNETSGFIKTPRFPKVFPKYAQCEWWIKAPEDRRIRLDIGKLAVKKSRKCMEAYVVVNRAGDTEYPADTSDLFCGNAGDMSITSTGNQMNVVFDGGPKRLKGMKAYYHVI
ncbi:ovochymase-1-like isoform X2 [Macrobrachium rosenbergii]|uniref:ovochymase-1-like isoform X2 n=1 Tax=Macrobrachium rosenbergii TaxID=79674 RepID=UPI0034D4EE1F